MVRFVQGVPLIQREKSLHAGAAGLALVLALASMAVSAQTVTPAKTDGGAADIKTPYLDNYTPSEEVKRRALGPLRIIKQMGEQKRATPAPAAAPVPVAAPAPAPVAKPKVAESAVKSLPAEMETAAAPVVVAPAPVPVVPVAAAPVPVVKPINREIIAVLQDPPEYSPRFLRDNAKATVKVAFDVKPDGSTGAIEVLSSTNRRLDQSALDAVAKWKFRPIDEVVRVDIELNYSAN